MLSDFVSGCSTAYGATTTPNTVGRDDAVVRRAEEWLSRNLREPRAVAAVLNFCGIPERSLKRRFKTAAGTTLIGHVQNLRMEEAKRLLETDSQSADEIAAVGGYDNPAFFRRLFKRSTGLTPGGGDPRLTFGSVQGQRPKMTVSRYSRACDIRSANLRETAHDGCPLGMSRDFGLAILAY
jgi:AraC-like DNA-binding protein